MTDPNETDAPVETGNDELYGTTVADGRHVGDAEADAARNIDEVEEELPPADPEFDDEGTEP